MKKYQADIRYSIQVEANNKAEAEEKALQYIESEEGQGVRLQDMELEIVEQ